MTKDATFLYKDVSLGESVYWATSPHPKRGKKFCWDDHSAWDDFRDSCGHRYHCGWDPDVTWCHKTKLMNSSMTPGNSPGSKLWLQMAAALPGTRAPAPSCWPRNPSLTRNKGRDKKLLSPHWHLGQTGWISRCFMFANCNAGGALVRCGRLCGDSPAVQHLVLPLLGS